MKYCALSINGVLIDEALPLYTTINVEGRSFVGRKLDTVTVPARDGVFVRDGRLDARTITVKYAIKASSASEYLETLQALHKMLTSGEDMRIQFGDEDYHRYGRLSAYKEPPSDQFQGTGTFSFLCQDPYRYRDPVTFTDLTVPSELGANAKLNDMEITLGADTSQVRITNPRTGKKIQLDGAYRTGDVLKIAWGDALTITKGAVSTLSDLNISSDVEMFSINAGDVLEIQPTSATVKITAQRREI